MVVEVVGLDTMKSLYEDDVDFMDAWKSCKEPWSMECGEDSIFGFFCLGRILIQESKVVHTKELRERESLREITQWRFGW